MLAKDSQLYQALQLDFGLALRRPIKSLTDGSKTLVYGKNDPFRSWPISANELEEVAMGSETNV
jgi:hypothetical protein